MPKQPATIYICTNCSAQSPKWSGRCLECGAWGTYREDVDAPRKTNTAEYKLPAAQVVDMSAITGAALERLKTGMHECDRTLGGGIVPGSLVLIGGEPGIGKSTLILHIARAIRNTLYVSGEESAQQIKSRMDRLSIADDTLKLVTETNVERVIAAIIKLKPALVLVDSIQTMYSTEVETESGAINQIRACTVKLLQTAKEHNIAIIITGHITKDGTLAGPKTLEHLVDTVVYLEQQRNSDIRILRTVKNRFGSTDEIGLFEMTQAGFREIANPSAVFLDTAHESNGTVISCIMEGTRPFLLEIQALVTKTVFGYPQRKASGFDLNRLQILLAVLSKRAQVNVATQDVHVNVVGGLRVTETGLDAALCAAVVSSLTNIVIPKTAIIIGEVGLGGEIRSVHKLEMRLNEAKKLGFKTAVIPSTIKMTSDGLTLLPMRHIGEVVEWVKKLH